VASRNTMIVREDMHTHYTQVSFKDEFQNTVVHSKNANWNKIHKRDFERLYSNTCVAFVWVYSLWQGYTKRQRRGWRERAEADKNGQVERQKMAGGDGYTSQKWLGQWHRQRGQLKSVSNIVASVLLVVSYTPSSNFKSHLLLSKDKICDASFYVFFSEK